MTTHPVNNKEQSTNKSEQTNGGITQDQMRQAIASNLKFQPNDMNYQSNMDPKMAGFDYNNPGMMSNQMRTMMMPNTVDNMQGGGLMNHYANGITSEMINNN
jgi:hypothetical protein